MLSRGLLILSLLAVTRLAACDRTNDIIHPETLTNRNLGFTLVNPKQVVQLERTIKLLLGRIAAPVRQPVALRSSSVNDTALQRTISQISWSIRKKLLEFAEACGLHRAARVPEQFHSNATDDWFSEMLLQGSLVLTDLGIMADHLSVSTKNYFYEHDVILSEGESLTLRNNSVQFLGAIDDFSQFSDKVTKCLKEIADKAGKGFNLIKVLMDLLKGSPGYFTRTLRNRLDKNLSSRSTSHRFIHAHMVICALAISSGGEYSECIDQLKGLSECLASYEFRPIKSPISTRTFDRQWLRSITHLDDCKVKVEKEGEIYMTCKSGRKMPVNIKHRVRYIYERMLNQKVPKSSSLHRAASELGDVLSRSELGEKFTTELWQYLAVYEEGQQKLKRLSKSAGTDAKIRGRFNKVSKALQVYKQGLLSRTINAIGKVHTSAYNFEKLLVKEMRTRSSERWFGQIGILTCLANWMVTVLQLLFGKDDDSTSAAITSTTTPPTPTIPPPAENSWSDENSDVLDQSFDLSDEENTEQPISRSKAAVTKLVDRSMKDLIRSMQHVTKYRSPTDRSTLARLANNLLLVAMFMETIGFISTLFCVGNDQQNQANSEEMYNSWRTRQKRNPNVNPIILDHPPFEIELDRNTSITYFESADWQFYEELIPSLEFSQEDIAETIPVIINRNITDEK